MGSRIVLFILLCLQASYIIATQRLSQVDQDDYARYGFALAEWGVYGRSTSTDTPPPADMGRAPLYPAFLAVMIHADPSYRAWAKCMIDEGASCPSRSRFVPVVQVLLTLLALFVMYEMCLMLEAPSPIALLVTFLASSELFRLAYAHTMSEAVAIPLFGLASFALMRCFRSPTRLLWPAMAGVALGLLALSRLAFAHFLPLIAVSVFALPGRERRTMRQRALGALALICAYGAVVAPWYARNIARFDTAAIGQAAASNVLAMRVLYNRMTFEEGLAATIYFLPGVGDVLARQLFAERVTSRFDASNPEGFRQQGRAYFRKMQATYPHAPDLRRALLLEMFASPVRHVAVALPLAIDGLSKMFWFVPLALIGAVAAGRKGDYWKLSSMALAVITFGFHAGLTHFRARYGQPMIFAVAPLAALGIGVLVSAAARRWEHQSRRVTEACDRVRRRVHGWRLPTATRSISPQERRAPSLTTSS